MNVAPSSYAAAPSSSRPMAPAKLRILETADHLFTVEGIRSVGIDRLISESSVTKATFYKHYGSKDRLVTDYVAHRHRTGQKRIDELAADGPESIVRGVVADALTEIDAPGFRGSAFVNAASEFSDSAHLVRVLVRDHREWFAVRITGALDELTHPMAGEAADDLVMAIDGALSGAFAGDAVAARAALTRSLDRVLAGIPR